MKISNLLPFSGGLKFSVYSFLSFILRVMFQQNSKFMGTPL